MGRYVYLTNYSHVYSTSAAGTRASLSFFFFQSWPVKLLALLTKRFIVWQHRSTDFICGRILRHGFLARNSILQTGAILRSHKFPLRRQFHNTVKHPTLFIDKALSLIYVASLIYIIIAVPYFILLYNTGWCNLSFLCSRQFFSLLIDFYKKSFLLWNKIQS